MIDIQQLADTKGIERTYLDVTNNLTYIPERNRAEALRIMGYPIDDEKLLEDMLYKEKQEELEGILDTVTVLNDDDRKQFIIITPESFGEDESAELTVSITLEDGRRIERTMPLYEVEIADYETFDGKTYDKRRYHIISALPYGYHECQVRIKSGSKTLESEVMSLIMAPSRVYTPKEILEGKKVWGVSVQLYAVRSQDNWGIGDFEDLRKLLINIKHCGGEFVGLNPLHAGYPAISDGSVISPYSPSSRNFLNIIYISVPQVPELANCKEALELIASEKFQQRLHVLRDKGYVDYHGVVEAKLEVLRVIYAHVKVDDKRTNRGQKFLNFMEEGGEDLLNMATYDALQFHYYKKGFNAYSWEKFDKEFQDVNSPFLAQWRQEHENEIKFNCYLQFLAQEQLDIAYRAAQKEQMLIGTYRDLAVGVPKQSCDVWSDRYNVFRSEGSIGAPPDPLGPLGQSWGLSPIDPKALKKACYKPIIKMYRSNMQSCGAIRIDHAAGLYRLWITRLDHSAKEGAYVKFPLHDLLGIVALESYRNKCLVIAEDLGTIPPELREGLKKVGAFSYKIFFHERAYDGGYIAPRDYPKQMLSALTTHDMPTLIGWWDGLDLKLGVELGIYTKDQAQSLREIREDCKQRILDSMHGLGSVSHDFERDATKVHMDAEFVKAMQVHMCKGSCSLFSSQLEDWIGVEKPVNVPGTSDQYPNWRRKLTADLEYIFKQEQVLSMTSAMTSARESAD